MGDWTQKVKESVVAVPFPTQITFDHPILSTAKPTEPLHVRWEDILLYRDAKSPPTNMAQIISDVCMWAYAKQLALPILLHIKFDAAFFTQFPGDTCYTPL